MNGDDSSQVMKNSGGGGGGGSGSGVRLRGGKVESTRWAEDARESDKVLRREETIWYQCSASVGLKGAGRFKILGGWGKTLVFVHWPVAEGRQRRYEYNIATYCDD